MSQTPTNPFGRTEPQRRDDWDTGFGAGLYEGNAGKLRIEREHDRLAARAAKLEAAGAALVKEMRRYYIQPAVAEAVIAWDAAVKPEQS